MLAGLLAATGLVAARTVELAPYAWLLFVAAGVVPVLRQVAPGDDETPVRVAAVYVGSTLLWGLTPWGVVAQCRQLAGIVRATLRYRGRPPNRDRRVPTTALRPPFDGRWTVVNGGVTRADSHSWGILSQRYAYDFLVTDDEGDTHAGAGTELTDYYAFGRPIRAPADGTVVAVRDDLRDFPAPGTGRVEWRTGEIAGNHVLLDHGDGEYCLLAHLRQGSVAVAPGDTVARGERVGDCGNSGLSTEPHLHLQLQDRPDFWSAAGLVPRFVDADLEPRDPAAGDADGRPPDGASYLRPGDRVRPRATGPGTVDWEPETGRR